MSVIISPEQLAAEISRVLLFDCRFDLALPVSLRGKLERLDKL